VFGPGPDLGAFLPGSLSCVTDVGISTGPSDGSDQMQVRVAKAERMRAAGVDPYPVGYSRTHMISELRDAYGDLGPDTSTGVVAGVLAGSFYTAPAASCALRLCGTAAATCRS
jgi:lysyl-tRNA synthetase class II